MAAQDRPLRAEANNPVRRPDPRRLLERVLDSGEDPSPEQLVDLLVEATESVPRRVVFVLDDFHFLDSISETFQEVLNGWLYRLPYECHVVLSGRTQPQLGLLPLMSARQEVEWIIAKDFSFTCEEVAQLFRAGRRTFRTTRTGPPRMNHRHSVRKIRTRYH